MFIFKHRINTTELLQHTSTSLGVELDLRSNGNDIYIHHDAFGAGELFSEWLKSYQHSGIILNTKCEGLEEKLLELMEKNGISSYFFLDLSLPFLIKYMKRNVKNIAVRFSQFEPLEFVMPFAGKVDWVWVDCFDGNPIPNETMNLLCQNFKVCAVSPELQGFDISQIEKFKLAWNGIDVHAVCTKYPELWQIPI